MSHTFVVIGQWCLEIDTDMILIEIHFQNTFQLNLNILY